jgi:hypothetical protein
MAPKLAFNDLANKEQLELETARNCYVCKTHLLKCTTFMILCVLIVAILITLNVSDSGCKGQIAIITGSRLK